MLKVYAEMIFLIFRAKVLRQSEAFRLIKFHISVAHQPFSILIRIFQQYSCI